MYLIIMSNFISNQIKKYIPRDPPWIGKSMLQKKNVYYRNYKNKEED